MRMEGKKYQTQVKTMLTKITWYNDVVNWLSQLCIVTLTAMGEYYIIKQVQAVLVWFGLDWFGLMMTMVGSNPELIMNKLSCSPARGPACLGHRLLIKLPAAVHQDSQFRFKTGFPQTSLTTLHCARHRGSNCCREIRQPSEVSNQAKGHHVNVSKKSDGTSL